MQIAGFKTVAPAGLCIPLPIRLWRFRVVFGEFGVALGLSVGARIIVRVTEFSL